MSVLGFLSALPVWLANGTLFLLYWLVGHLAQAIALVAGLIILFGIDPEIQRRASDRSRRYGRGEVQTSAPTAQYYTLFVMLVWLAVAGISQFPVPVIGAGMWWVGLAAILAVSEERFNQLWWVKTGVLLYAVLVVLLRLGLLALQMTSPAAWASVMGGSAEAQIALASTRNSVGMIGMLIVFVMYPVGYAGMLFNRYLRNPKPLYNMFTEAGTVIKNLRTRQKED